MIKAITGGYETKHPSTYQMSRPNGLPNYVLLIIRTHGEYQLGETCFTANPGDALLISPGTPYHYGNPQGDYVDDWIHFSIEESHLKEQLDRLSNTAFPVGNIELYTFCIRQILWELSYGHPDYAKANMDHLFQLLFRYLLAAYETRNNSAVRLPYCRELQSVRLEIINSFSEPHSIEKHARTLKISESYFQYLYKKFFGVSFHHDLIQIRIDHAKYSLLTSNLPIERIAETCGYTNEVHFYRQFKKITGTSPAKFRKSAGF